jgi:predicted TIM-barrel fold metal-dependent hydrolase
MRLLDRVGGYSKLVLAHLGGNEMTREVIDTLAGEDVYMDTAYNLGEVDRAELYELFEKHGAERILFATDSPWQDIGREAERIRSFGLSERELSLILSENAKKLLSL